MRKVNPNTGRIMAKAAGCCCGYKVVDCDTGTLLGVTNDTLTTGISGMSHVEVDGTACGIVSVDDTGDSPVAMTVVSKTSCANCYECTGSPSTCDGCCYSSGSKALFTFYKYTCEYDDVGCVGNLIARDSTMIKVADGKQISLDWISANTWRSSARHNYAAGTSLSGCPPTAPSIARYVWLRKNCSTGAWEYAVTSDETAPGSYSAFITKILDSANCCSGSRQQNTCTDNAPRSIRTFVDHQVAIQRNGCCESGGNCVKGTDSNCDGDCETTP